jgi:hypothetical protein
MPALEHVSQPPDGFGLTSGDEVQCRLGQAVLQQADDDIVREQTPVTPRAHCALPGFKSVVTGMVSI